MQPFSTSLVSNYYCGSSQPSHRQQCPLRAVRERSQSFNLVTKQFVERDAESGRLFNVEKGGKPFEGVQREKKREPPKPEA